MLTGNISHDTDFSSCGTGRTSSRPARRLRSEMGGAIRSSTHLQFNAGLLTVGTLDDGADMLATMRYDGPANLRPEPSYRVRDGVDELGYVARRDAEGQLLGPPVVIHGEHASMHLQLARDIPLALSLEFGAGESDLDLTGIRARNVELHSGAGRSRVRVPDSAGQTVVTVSGGIGEVALQIPTGVAADIYVSGGIVKPRGRPGSVPVPRRGPLSLA